MHRDFHEFDLEGWGASVEPALLEQALTHRSWAFEHGDAHNERLEFLGDSILGGVVARRIYLDFPESDEGEMSKIKAASVSEKSLAQIARRLNLGEFIRLGKGEERSGGREKDSILSDTVEALIAATFLSSDISVVKGVIERHLLVQIEAASKMGPALDWRTALEELARARGIPGELSYEIVGSGPDHARSYEAHVFLGGVEYGVGTASSQKMAKLAACENAYHSIQG
ncbi:ribonuclease-3 [Arcanobacterium wilhelmae]|uniref:Ribonuclease 3 n=1 Tax=Arcanobacterium wilhelmae TaxID=1803177 RepID=A0ABT9ND26_9ACTO|nr:ribonuclease III [Arcanobacterium wilhelmae]MDP9801623.1 ribonuclease-3 [Arcanobacterium wilhelmae]WFN90946.1 ribonuclease III [Arcanobacterium wilhelmae]